MRLPIRAVAIIIRDNQVLLMKRRNRGKKYYVFPGGGVEEGETVEQAVLREVQEETTLQIKIERLLYHHRYSDKSNQYFYLCSYVSGEPALGEGNEQEDMRLHPNDLYLPLFVPIDTLPKLLLYPLEIRDWLIEDVKRNFHDVPRVAAINLADLRHTL